MTGYRLGLVPKIKSRTQRNVVSSLHKPSGAFICKETAH